MKQDDQTPAYEREDLKRDLSNRHIQMIAIGGAIGTGLFYGSSWAIRTAGPAILLVYALAAIAIYFVMRALGEMAVEEPVSGSYVSYSNRYIHRFAGFLNGWNAFIFLLATSAADLNALGNYVHFWFPAIPIWVTAGAAVSLMFFVNIIGVKIYGEAEFWFALVKVVAIVAMILFGAGMIMFGIGNNGVPIGYHNLVAHGGFFAKGLGGTFLAIVMVAFSFGGVENLGLAAGEAKDVKTTMPKAVNSTFWRLLIFYVGAIAVLLMVFPWTSLTTKGSPFVDVFTKIGIPAAAGIMNLVVIMAVLSAVNASVFTNSRTFYNLSLQKNAPAFLGVVNPRKVPHRAILMVFATMFAGVLLNYIMPEQAFELFSSVTVFALVCAWGSIVISHLKFRKIRMLNGDADKIAYRMPFYPYSNYLALLFVAAVMVCIAILPDMRMSLIVSAVWVGVVFVAYRIHTRHETARDGAHEAARDPKDVPA
ncbi:MULTISPECIES: amino acid permease [unclassified Burkholderia]|uniref:amino acid permease n=1 Tax=unclassified Burkholderia TaxID=2613784 RepID=UPI000F567445|nr:MULTISPECIES: amino acid permease [unclassified Burkholderia]RQR68697.1 amino acid permease [Burkholderia sp. Bp9012]RQR70629.1 amino acid permease [Burkholderia sp. Bp9011]RQR83626.1 amino acid permease [Burkholderia sp. Bp9010]